MRILIANDDDIASEGIHALVEQLKGKYELYIAAPDRQRSGSSHSATYFTKDLKAERILYEGVQEAWKINGTPADCVYCAVCGLLKERPDLVISGINDGPNYSTDCIYSGTIGAASEGQILGIPSMAVSLLNDSCGYQTSAEYTEKLIPYYLSMPDRDQYVFSINLPALKKEEIKGIRITHLDGLRKYERPLDVIEESKNVFLLHSANQPIPLKRNQEDESGDVKAVEEGYVSITPLGTDLAAHAYMKDLKMLEDIHIF